VREECLLGSLFVRPAYHQYCFGDYFETRYEKQYVPWTRYHLPGAAYDCLFAYYRQHAGDRGWEHSIQSLYTARYGGNEVRLPRTLAEQELFVRKVSSERRLTVTELQRVTVLATVAQYEGSGHHFETLRREDAVAYGQSAVALRQFGQQFQQRERQLYSDPRGAERFDSGPIIVKWKDHPHGGPPGQLKKHGGPPPFPGRAFEGDGEGHKGEKKKGKG
jgi:hypothetical protein